MTERTPKPGMFYRYFKEKVTYQIVALARNAETGEDMVVYQALYPPYRTYVCGLRRFAETVDRKKYPDARQIYCFEPCSPVEELQKGTVRKMESAEAKNDTTEKTASEKAPEPAASAAADEEDTKEELHPEFRRFLDAETYGERIEILKGMRKIVDNTMINSIAVMMDVEIKDGPIEERYGELLECMQLKHRYEIERY